jgi:hypothetical protein
MSASKTCDLCKVTVTSEDENRLYSDLESHKYSRLHREAAKEDERRRAEYKRLSDEHGPENFLDEPRSTLFGWLRY